MTKDDDSRRIGWLCALEGAILSAPGRSVLGFRPQLTLEEVDVASARDLSLSRELARELHRAVPHLIVWETSDYVAIGTGSDRYVWAFLQPATVRSGSASKYRTMEPHSA
jgi:hypothetical protein